VQSGSIEAEEEYSCCDQEEAAEMAATFVIFALLMKLGI
jgi:hypothetical protein